MKKIENESVWAESYRPQTVADTILPTAMKAMFQSFVDKGDVENHLLLSGKPGMGKTTVAKAMAEDIGADYLVIPASTHGGIDILRDKMTAFASTVSFTDVKRKILILDEADGLNPNSTQPALRNFMDDYGHNCALVMTCNSKSKIIDPLKSRVNVIDFVIPKEERPRLAGTFSKRIGAILENEGVTYDNDAVVEVIKKKFPDWRSVLNHLQRVANENGNHITVEKARNFSGDNFADLMKHIQAKAFTEARKWVAVNADFDTEGFYRAMYENVEKICADAGSYAVCIRVIGQYLYQESFVADSEINRAAMVAALMMEGDFK